MIKVNKIQIGEHKIEQCKCCGTFFDKGTLYEIKISPMDEFTKEMQVSATMFQLCENCVKELITEMAKI